MNELNQPERYLKKLLARFARVSPAMIVAMIALFVALSGTAVATTSALVGSAQIRNNSITGLDVKNRSLRPIDFRGSVRGPRGLRGLLGAPGARGAPGEKGDKGDTGPPGAPNPNAVDSDKVDGYDANSLVRAQTVSLTGAFGTPVSPAVTELTMTAPADGVALAEASCWAYTGASPATLQFGMRTGGSTTFVYEDMAANDDALVSTRRSSTLVAGTDYVFQVRRAHFSGSGAACNSGTYSVIFVPFKLDGSSH